MPQQKQADPGFRPVDPWQIMSYLIAGVAVYGTLGWLADQWLGTSFLVGVGIVLGVVLAMYLIWRRLDLSTSPEGSSYHSTGHPPASSPGDQPGPAQDGRS